MKKLCLLLATLGFTASVLAAEPATPPARDTYYSSGYFVGLNLGQTNTDLLDLSPYQKKSKGFFGHAYVGYNINHYIALQLGYLHLPTAKYTHPSLADIKVSSSGFDGLLRGKYPLGEGFSVFANVGGALVKSRQRQDGVDAVTQDATVLAYGGGVDYVFANVGGLHMNMNYYHTDNKKTHSMNVPGQSALSVGVYYQF